MQKMQMRTQIKDGRTAAISDKIYLCPVCGGVGEYISDDLEADAYPNEKPIYAPGTRIPVAHRCPQCNGGLALRAEQARKVADIPRTFYDARMADFDWAIYCDEKGNAIDLTKHEKYINSFVNQFREWEKRGLGLYLWSVTRGSGKTYLASCVCNEIMEKQGVGTRFVSAGDLLNLVQSRERDSPDAMKSNPVKLMQTCRLLVLDDLGAKNNGTGWLNDILFQILDARMTSGLVTIITSNVKIDSLQLDDRIVDRLNRVCVSIPLPDYCVRAKEASEEKKAFFETMGLL